MPLPFRVSSQRFEELVEVARRVMVDEDAARPWGIYGPSTLGRRLVFETQVRDLPAAADIVDGLLPDAKWWVVSKGNVVVYQINHENSASSEHDLVRFLVRSLSFAYLASRDTPMG
jgi:hypothetical protein